MRKKFMLSLLIVSVVFSLATIAVVGAYTPKFYGDNLYDVTSNYHGIDVPPGAQVVVTALTIDDRVDKVRFIWRNAAGQVIWDETVNVFENGTTYNDDGTPRVIRYAKSIHSPNTLGDWGVQAKFLDRQGWSRWTYTVRLATRATSFNVIPEIPVIGTAGASIAMLLGLVYKAKRKKNTPAII